MAKIVEYALVQDTFSFAFEKEVNRHLAAGWELHGELKVAGVYGDRGYGAGDEPIFCFAQALVRPEGIPPFKSTITDKPSKRTGRPQKKAAKRGKAS
jgi:hypothetical protein